MFRFVCMVLLMVAAPPALAGWKEGDAAYRNKQFEEALKELLPLAEMGHDRAQYRVARILFGGMGGVKQNKPEGLKWLRRSADAGNVDAQYALGTLYAKGEGVNQDPVFAFMWFAISANKGFQDSIRARETMRKSMTRGQIDEGERLARNWQPKR
ncbi:MAG: sel1 repeat family protein [Alphaproteobacteria bacterium]|nr:sel1 repeat family protein [Alphaproteobacteria bacterium]